LALPGRGPHGTRPPDDPARRPGLRRGDAPGRCRRTYALETRPETRRDARRLMIDPAASFTGLVDLASASLGGRASGTNDDFFASIDNLVLPGRGVFVEGKFTDRGKW